MNTIVIAFLVGLAVTVWLAYRQSRYRPMFAVERKPKIDPLWWMAAGSAAAGVGLLWAAVATGVVRVPEVADALPFVGLGTTDRLLIPSLNIDQKIVRVPLNDGEWDISRLGVRVGRLESTGERSGDDLAMALIGHVTVSAVERGPFADLHTLKPLDTVIFRSGGEDYVYAIGSIEEVKPDEVARLYNPKGDHLLLITCTDWNFVSEQYDGRLLVDAVLVKKQPTQ